MSATTTVHLPGCPACGGLEISAPAPVADGIVYAGSIAACYACGFLTFVGRETLQHYFTQQTKERQTDATDRA